MRTKYKSVEGLAQSETWTAHVNGWSGVPYSETFTHSATPPASQDVWLEEGVAEKSWKSPMLDKSSFKAIKESGMIKMTNYDRGTLVTTDAVVRVPRCAYTFIKRGAYTLNQQNTGLFDVDAHLFDLQAPYHLVADATRLRTLFPSAYSTSIDMSSIEDEIQGAVNGVMADVVGQLNSSYDLLTELAELRETMEFIHSLLKAAVNPLSTLRSAACLRSVAKWGDLWMQYRYALMPLIYSIKDALETMRRIKLVYHTERAFRIVEKTINTYDRRMGTQFFEVYTTQHRISGVGKARPSEFELLRLIDAISANPFKTAWEKIPFSFVVDWFVNVGNFIEAQTGALVNFSQQRAFCYAIKSNSVRSYMFHDYFNDIRTLSTGPWTTSQGFVIFPRVTKNVGQVYDNGYLLRRETLSSYSRRVFSPSDVEIDFNASLNWKRWVDSFVLSWGKTRNLLRGA